MATHTPTPRGIRQRISRPGKAHIQTVRVPLQHRPRWAQAAVLHGRIKKAPRKQQARNERAVFKARVVGVVPVEATRSAAHLTTAAGAVAAGAVVGAVAVALSEVAVAVWAIRTASEAEVAVGVGGVEEAAVGAVAAAAVGEAAVLVVVKELVAEL